MHFWAWRHSPVGLVAEIRTMSLVLVSFEIAAIAGALAADIWSNSLVQWISFAIAAVLTLGILRPFVRRYLSRKTVGGETGIDALILSPARALSEITSSGGTIRLQNETWTARCESETIPAGAEVTVTRIDGAVAIVIPNLSTLNTQGELR